MSPTITLKKLIDTLEAIRASRLDGGDNLPVRLICDGTAWPAVHAWLEPRQEGGTPAVCVGDDPR